MTVLSKPLVDKNHKYPKNDKEKFSNHPMAKLWNYELNHYKPEEIRTKSTDKYYFNCDVCHHVYQTSPCSMTDIKSRCSYCSNKTLCNNENCQICHKKSFASNPRSLFWNNKKNGSITPRQVFRATAKVYHFTCGDCGTDFNISLHAISKGHWCNNCYELRDKHEYPKSYDVSFASDKRSNCWSSLNKYKPEEVCIQSHMKIYFECDKCDHIFETSPHSIIGQGSWCPYHKEGRNILCDNIECLHCNDRSFNASIYSEYWNYELNDVTPRQVTISSSVKFYFTCNACPHIFKTNLSDLYHKNAFCPYCGKQDICDSETCMFCYNNSFATVPLSKYWNFEKNIIDGKQMTPRIVYKCTDKKYWFNCIECKFLFKKRLADITQKNSFCPMCTNKSEKILYDFLKPIFPNIICQYKNNWCKNPLTNKHLPFDFAIPEYNTLIEVDGRQHYEKVSNWPDPEETMKNDIYKQKCANKNGYFVLRIIQQDIFYNRTNWKHDIIDCIKQVISMQQITSLQPQNYYIGYKSEYAKHIKLYFE